MAKVITFTKPIAQITDLVGSAVAGGSVAVGTYYYVIVAANSDNADSRTTTLSPISNEVTVTTTAGNQTASLTWTSPGTESGYFIFRSTQSGHYDDRKAFISNSSYLGTIRSASCPTGSFSDDGTYTARDVGYFPIVLQNSPVMLGLSPSTKGIGNLTFTGGTSGDPITLQDIYDASVTDGWTDWIYYDGKILGLLANFYHSSATETHFFCTNGELFLYGRLDIPSINASSNIQFGVMYNDVPQDGCTIHCMTGNSQFWLRNLTMYNCKIVGMYSSTYEPLFVLYGVYYATKITILSGCTINDLTIDNMTYIAVKAANVDYVRVNVVGSQLYFSNASYHTNKIKGWTSGNYYQYFALDERLDEYTCTYTSYHIRFRTNIVNYLAMIDPIFLNGPTDYGYPRVSWKSGTPSNADIDLFHSIRVHVVDNQGTAISGANFRLYDVNGDLTSDFGGDDFDFNTNSLGDLWLETIDITSATDSTITDISKSWTVDEWVGRNIYVSTGDAAGYKRKVTSNTSNTLTFNEFFSNNPSSGDTAGFILEVRKARMEPSIASATSVSTTTVYTPHEIKISKNGYETYKGIIEINDPQNLTFRLRNSPSAGRDEMGDEFR